MLDRLAQHFPFLLKLISSPMSRERKARQGIGDSVQTGSASKLIVVRVDFLMDEIAFNI
ncbi:MAG: hypothetical protein AAF943_13215 [Pseudomonadota bacterium]